MRGEDKSSCLKKTDLLFCTTFSSCNMCLLRFIQYLSYLSLSCTLSLFFYLSPSLSLFGHSDVRFTASLTGAAGEFPSAVWSLIPPNLSFCSLCALRLKTTRFLRLWLFFFFWNHLPLWIRNHPPVALQVKTKRVPFSEMDLKDVPCFFVNYILSRTVSTIALQIISCLHFCTFFSCAGAQELIKWVFVCFTNLCICF